MKRATFLKASLISKGNHRGPVRLSALMQMTLHGGMDFVFNIRTNRPIIGVFM